MKSRKKYYSIGEMSAICDVNPKTLRYYDQIDLVKPSYKSEASGYRYYLKEQAFTIYTIKKLQQLEFSLKEIKQLIQTDSLEAYEEAIGKKITYLDRKIEDMNRIRNEGMMLLNKVSNDKDYYQLNSTYDADEADEDLIVHIEDIPVRRVLYTSKEMHNYNNIEISIERWFEVYRLAEREGLTPAGHMILCYLTDSVMDQFYKSEIRLEICLPVDEASAAKVSPDSIKEYGGFRAAVYYHYGKYDTIHQSHLDVLRWIDAHKYTIDGPMSEEYLISPFDLKSGDNYLTKIIYPVKK